MCGRYALNSSVEELSELFAIEEIIEPLPPPSFNIAPTAMVPAVLERHLNTRRRRLLMSVQWGLVPPWSKDASKRLINARAETVAEKPAFRESFAKRRCLLPATGYYEWSPGPGGKQPYFISPDDGSLFVMAGLYQTWQAPSGEPITTVAIITTAATGDLALIHDRVPLSMPPDRWGAWLDPDFGAQARGLLDVPEPRLGFHPVSRAVNRVSNDTSILIEPIR